MSAYFYPQHPGLASALGALRAGDVVAYPTEAVWGLGCDPWNPQAVAQVLALKKRAMGKGVILVAASIAQLDFLLHDLPREKYATLLAAWPGPYTFLVPHKERVPVWIHGDFETVAVRVSAHPGVQALCAGFGGPLVSTSANRQGCKPARFGFQARRYFGQAVTYAPGAVGALAKPTQIQDLMTGALVRGA